MKTVSDGLASLSIEVCRFADREDAEAKEHALKSIDGDLNELSRAKECRARASAYMVAVKKIDEFRFGIEQGDYK